MISLLNEKLVGPFRRRVDFASVICHTFFIGTMPVIAPPFARAFAMILCYALTIRVVPSTRPRAVELAISRAPIAHGLPCFFRVRLSPSSICCIPLLAVQPAIAFLAVVPNVSAALVKIIQRLADAAHSAGLHINLGKEKRPRRAVTRGWIARPVTTVADDPAARRCRRWRACDPRRSSSRCRTSRCRPCRSTSTRSRRTGTHRREPTGTAAL